MACVSLAAMSSLEGLPPPRRGAGAGYYPDPLRTGRARWWNGNAWALRMGPRVSPEAPADRAVPPPKKVCKRCGAEAETFAAECPSCGRSYTQSTGLIVGLIAAALVLLLLVGGCAALIVAGIDEIEDLEPSNAITQEEFDSVRLGGSRAAIQGRLGRPDEVERFRTKRGQVTCILYNDADESVFQSDAFRICFAGDRAYAKTEDG